MNPKYNRNDFISLELNRIAARRLRQNPLLLQDALDNIQRWARPQGHVDPPHQEWQKIIAKGLPAVLAVLEDEESDNAQRLRSSTPFVGDQFVTQQERLEVLGRYSIQLANQAPYRP